MKKQIIAAGIVGLMMLAGIGTLNAEARGPPTEDIVQADTENHYVLEVDLMAGQHMDVGNVTVETYGDYLNVTYEVLEPDWYLQETHLHIGEDDADIPQTKKGNPIPGHFNFTNESHSLFITEYTWHINYTELGFEPGDTVAIAAHAVVAKIIGEGCENPFWACNIVEFSQGMGWDISGNPIDVAEGRSIPTNALGEPDGNFVSLGHDGSLTVEFEYPVYNGDGEYDISVHEISRNRGFPEEAADVYVVVNGDEYYVGYVDSTGTGIGTVGIPEEFNYIEAVKIVDATNKSLHVGEGFPGDGYDVDAVDACYLFEQEETAWAKGDRFTRRGNWGMYFEYTIPPAPDFEVLELIYTNGTLMPTWEDVGGGYSSYTLDLDGNPATRYYLNTNNTSIDTNVTLANGYYGFYVDPDEQNLTWWNDTKGVNESVVGGWQEHMWEILMGNEPIFYLKVWNAGMDYMLLDGLHKDALANETYLIVDGDYPTGLYHYTGTLSSQYGVDNTIQVSIEFT